VGIECVWCGPGFDLLLEDDLLSNVSVSVS
jgi:hypothetical protein